MNRLLIIKCSDAGFWYNNKINQVYNIVRDSGAYYEIDSGSIYKSLYVLKEDCIIGSDIRKREINSLIDEL